MHLNAWCCCLFASMMSKLCRIPLLDLYRGPCFQSRVERGCGGSNEKGYAGKKGTFFASEIAQARTILPPIYASLTFTSGLFCGMLCAGMYLKLTFLPPMLCPNRLPESKRSDSALKSTPSLSISPTPHICLSLLRLV